MGPGSKIVKWLMLLFNLVFWLTGIGLIIAGAVVQTFYKPYLSVLDSAYVSAPVLVIVIGAVITIIAFFGCCGSARENYCMLVTFSVLLFIIFIIELAGGITGYVERGRVSEYLDKNMHNSIQNFNSTHSFWDQVQAELKCCGADGYKDWFNSTIPTIPSSCCKSQNVPNCTFEVSAKCDSLTATVCPIYTDGCFQNLRKMLESHSATVGGVALGVAFIQLIGIVFSCFLARRIRQGYTYA